MNLYPLRRLLKAKGPAFATLASLKQQKSFPGAGLDGVTSSLNARHLIIGIGQVHPVLSGRFARWQARNIGVVQAWIYNVCAALVEFAQVDTFGQEGFSSPDGQPIRARSSEEILDPVRNALRGPGSESGFLKSAAARWRAALARRDSKAASLEAYYLNALVVLQARNERVSVFPIEHRAIHSTVGENINRMQALIQQIEGSDAYRNALGKGGKRLSPEEYQAMIRRNDLVQAFNVAISSPERDRAMFQAIVEQAELERKRRNDEPGQVLAAFVLGAAHKRGFLKLAKQYLPADMLFVWVTPAPLLFMRRLRDAIVAIVLLSIILLGIASQIVII